MPSLSSSIHLFDSNTPSILKAKRTYIIFFLPGNPGLIEYYRTFLTHLYGLLHSTSSSFPRIDFQVYGRSLAGYEVDVSETAILKRKHGKAPPYTVNEQIRFSEGALKDAVRSAKANGAKDVRVILMGHSLGTYICLEIMRRLRQEAEGVRVAGGALLFATVIHLARSPSGLRASGLIALPNFAIMISLLAKSLTLLMPTFLLTSLVSAVMGFPTAGARVTAGFLKSPYGVRQALFMANDEMKELSIDKWDEEIWGAAHPSPHPHPRPTLRFLFAESDHWIANETRDELIKARGMNGHAEAWKPVMEVDEVEGWRHDFCIRQSIPVAERASQYIEDIVQKDLDEK